MDPIETRIETQMVALRQRHGDLPEETLLVRASAAAVAAERAEMLRIIYGRSQPEQHEAMWQEDLPALRRLWHGDERADIRLMKDVVDCIDEAAVNPLWTIWDARP